MNFIKASIINKIINKDNSSASMKELEKKYEILRENVSYGQELVKVGSWMYDLKSEETFWSAGVYNILQSSPKELSNHLNDFYKYIHNDDIDKVKEIVDKVMARQEYDIEYRIITSIGTTKFLREKTKVLYDEEENPIRIIGTIQDITRDKLLEKDLRAIGNNLNLAQKIAGIGSWKYDVIKDEIFFL